MAQLSKGDTFTDGQQVTGARLNQLVDSAVLSVGAITDQTNITANTVASNDSVLLYDLSATALREANVSDVLNSGLNATFGTVITNTVNTLTGDDLQLTSTDKTIVNSKSFSSSDGINVTVFSTAHGLLANAIVLVSATVPAYSGTFRISSVTADEFIYVLNTPTTLNSGTCSYTKKASVSVNGNLVCENIFTNSNIEASGSFSSNGVANFKGTLQVNGTVGYVLTEITEETIPPYTSTVTGNFAAIWSSLPFTKPVGEVWVFELRFNYSNDTVTGAGVGVPFGYGIRYSSETAFTGTYKSAERFSAFSTSVSISYNGVQSRVVTWSEQVSTALTSNNVVFDTCTTASVGQKMFSSTVGIFAGYPSTPIVSSTLKIYKYKTA